MDPISPEDFKTLIMAVQELVALLKAPQPEPTNDMTDKMKTDALEAYADRKVAVTSLATKLGIDCTAKKLGVVTDDILKAKLGTAFRADASDEVKAAQIDAISAVTPTTSGKQTRQDGLSTAIAAPQNDKKAGAAQRNDARNALQANIKKLHDKQG